MSGPARRNNISAPFDASVVEEKLMLSKYRWPEVTGLPVNVPVLMSRFGFAGAWNDRFVNPK